MSGERRRGGRGARTAARAAGPAAEVLQPRRRIPTYELLDEESLDRLEAHADWILDEIGIEIRGDEEAVELFRSVGARVEGERLRFDPVSYTHLTLPTKA